MFQKSLQTLIWRALASIKPGLFFSYENGIQTFDTANVSLCGQLFASSSSLMGLPVLGVL
jgi:hypothetical protein